MADIVKVVAEGGKEVTLGNGETVRVRPLSLKVLRGIMSEIKDEPTSDMAFVTNILQAPRHLGELCGRDGDWFEDLPLEDELLIAETVKEVSKLEEVLPRFFALKEAVVGLTGGKKSSKR